MANFNADPYELHRAVNRGESYHPLRHTISYANYGKLRFGTEYEQHLWSECSRLITNCILFCNATLLSELLAHKEGRGDAQGAALVKQVSPVAWQHVNLYGRSEFLHPPEPVDVDEIVRDLAHVRIGAEAALLGLIAASLLLPLLSQRPSRYPLNGFSAPLLPNTRVQSRFCDDPWTGP